MWQKTGSWSTVGQDTESENRDFAFADATSQPGASRLTIKLKSEVSGQNPATGDTDESSEANAAWAMAWSGSARWADPNNAPTPTTTSLTVTISGSANLNGDSEDESEREHAAASPTYSVSVNGTSVESGSLHNLSKAGWPDFSQPDNFSKTISYTFNHTNNIDFVISISGTASCDRSGFDSKAGGDIGITGTITSFT